MAVALRRRSQCRDMPIDDANSNMCVIEEGGGQERGLLAHRWRGHGSSITWRGGVVTPVQIVCSLIALVGLFGS